MLYKKKRSHYQIQGYAPWAKLSVDNLAELKKALGEGKSTKSLVKKYKITDTQIFRIKREENWDM